MKNYFFSFLLILSFVFSAAAQKQADIKPSKSEKNLRSHVAYLASDKLEGRRTGETGATSAAGYAANVFARLKLKGGVKTTTGKSSFLQPFAYAPRNAKGEVVADAKVLEAYNVVGILEGRDAVLKNEAIIIGAHYDHLGKGGMGSLAVNSTEIHHGADDNASGVAAMLELARQFAKAKNNRRTIIFIAFGGEEEGLLGSKFYTANPSFPLEKTVAMINLDMVGRLNENKLTIGGIGTASEWKSLVESKNPNSLGRISTTGEENLKLKQLIENKLRSVSLNDVQVEADDNMIYLYGSVLKGRMYEAVAAAAEIGKKPITNYATEKATGAMPEFSPFNLQLNEDGFGPSDHSSFYAKQIPVLFFFTGAHADYHKPTDTAEKINYDGLLKITNYVGEIVKSIDQNATRPTYAVAKSTGNTGGRMSFNVTIGIVPGSYGEADGGLLIDGVRDNSPAAQAGMKAGDRIIKFAGKQIRNIQDYTALLGELKADTEYEIVVLRAAEQLTLKVKPAARK